jgi:TonB-dependent receptor
MTFKRILMTTASTLAIALSVQQANAQATQSNANATNADGSQIETVVVTGLRQSVKSALEIKRDADRMVDSIVAEDIGKLPDDNVVEALQHVTGVQISRNEPEANNLLIRGLPDISTLLNGREIFTSTGRFITLQDIPAELLARVDVEKTTRADDLEGGIAGTIDVRLHRPFDFDGLEIAGGLFSTYSSLSQHVDPKGSFLISDRWQTAMGEVGLLVDVSYSKDHYKEEIMDNYISTQPIGPVPGSTGPGGTAFLPLTQGAQSILGDRERLATDVSAQWAPNSSTEVFAEVFYTRYRNPNNVDFFVGLPWICANPATATVYPGTDEVKTSTGGCYDLTSDQSFVPKTDTYQVASGATWTGDRIKLSTEVDYTSSIFSQTGYILDSQYNPVTYTADTDYNGTGTPYMNVSGVNMTNASNFFIRQLYDQWQEETGNEIDWRGDLNYDVGDSWIRTIVAGLRYTDRFAENMEDNQGGLDCLGGANPSAPNFAQILAALASTACTTQPSLASLGAGHVTSGSQFNGKFGITQWTDASPTWLNDNIMSLRALFGQPTSRPAADPSQFFSDREQSYAGYAKANFDFDLLSMPVDGNFGVRLIETDAVMRGNTLIVSQTGPSTYTFTYTPVVSSSNEFDWLPSLNARLSLQDDLFLRLGLSKTVTRPQFSQLNPGLSLSNSTATLLGSGTAGNPNLSPEKSDNYDLSLEYYFAPSDSITGAVFYRNIDGYIQGAVNAETIGGITYQISTLTNAPPGHIDGAEIGYTQFFDFLPGPLSGLGVQANGTIVEGAFQNISKYSYNLIGIYEKGPVSVRVAYNWRSSFNAGPAPGGGQQPGTIFAKPQPWLDLSASYNVTDQVQITFDAKNMLNSYYQDAFGKGALAMIYPRDTREFDQTYSLGVRFKM